ncbi:ketoacyl-ACP synthase III family protein [Streptomyces sp. NPDC002742]|uniref:ketoacyl-ACP synthase III family protein n=1 Tax=Streptomyces sp. NPDC002742 TaxID=3364663 RepID=UPI0036B5DB7E
MRWNEMYIASTGICLPGRDSTADAVAEGRYDAQEQEKNGYLSVSVATDESAADMAVSAARVALGRAGSRAEEIALLLHANFYHQGVDHWTPASYIQQQTTGGRAPAIELKQASNGGLAGLVLALSFLAAHESGAALVTTADKFCAPTYDRYNSDKWIVLGDGASAAVVSRGSGFAKVLSTAMDSDSTLEEMYRGPFTDASHGADLPLDLRTRKNEYMERVGLAEVALRSSTGLLNVVKSALDDAELELDQISRFVFPNVGQALMQWDYLDAFGIDEARTTWDWGRQVGHIGAGDQFGGLNHLVETGRLGVGDRVMLAGSGIGFSWNCAVLEIQDVPTWDAR